VLRDMTDADGGFYSAEDADSAIDPAHPDEKGEGAFYIWSAAEIARWGSQPAAIGSATATASSRSGNVSQRSARRIHRQEYSLPGHELEDTALHFGPGGRDPRRLRGRRNCSKPAAKRARARISTTSPHRLERLMISAFAKAGAVLEEPRYAEAARRAADF
jgi:uncharacterized protein